MPNIVVLNELRYKNIDEVNISQRAREVALGMADDHEDYLKDGDLVTDVQELSERVFEHMVDELNTQGRWDEESPIEYEKAIDLGVFEAAREFYIRDEAFDDVPEVDLPYLVTACYEAGVKTPYTI